MPLELIQYYAAEIILALEYMHNKNILHRDLKPENILITNDWHLKIVKEKKKFIHIFQIDFGDAIKLGCSNDKVESEEESKIEQEKADFVGTPLYVSPEMLQENLSAYSGDIWALGCIIFQMITGDVPFKA